jgi:hypothetical protein
VKEAYKKEDKRRKNDTNEHFLLRASLFNDTSDALSLLCVQHCSLSYQKSLPPLRDAHHK